MCGPGDPLFTPLLPLARVPFQAKESVHKTPFWENLEILASTASIITQILAHKPPNLEIFSSQGPKFESFQLSSPQIWKFSAHKPPFQRQMSVRKPHTSEIRAAHPYLKKSWLPPPPPGLSHSVQLSWFFFFFFFLISIDCLQHAISLFFWIGCFAIGWYYRYRCPFCHTQSLIVLLNSAQ